MEKKARQEKIYQFLSDSDEPISASKLAEKLGVTRQVIVRDVELLKADKKPIISTYKGYFLEKITPSFQRVIEVIHDANGMEEELNLIVDFGGRVIHTGINHSIYGEMGQALSIKNRKDVGIFMENIKKSESQPLLMLTKGKHNHIIEADDENTLNEICEKLKEKGFLIL